MGSDIALGSCFGCCGVALSGSVAVFLGLHGGLLHSRGSGELSIVDCETPADLMEAATDLMSEEGEPDMTGAGTSVGVGAVLLRV